MNLYKEIARITKELAEKLEKHPRVERCIECGVFVSDWVECDRRNGRVCRPCEAVHSFRKQLAAAQSALAEANATKATDETELKSLMCAVAEKEKELATARENFDLLKNQTDRELSTEREAREKAEQERDEAREESQRRMNGWTNAEQDLKQTSGELRDQLSSLRAELAATQETVRRVEIANGNILGEHKRVLVERDALQKQNDQLKRQLSQTIT